MSTGIASSDRYSASALAPLAHAPGVAPSRSHLSLQITHPAAFAADPDAEYSPLEAPALPFSSARAPRRSRTRSAESGSVFGSGSRANSTRPSSSSSLPSLANGSSSSQSRHAPNSDSAESLPETFSRRDMHHSRGLSDAQEELLVEARSDREDGKDLNPYAWERPLDSVNRHSRMLDSSPLPTSTDPNGRRVSRLPPGVQMLDPFGFSVAAEASPYDLALNASSPSATPGVLSPSRSPVRASFLQPRLTSTATSASSHGGHSQFPSSSSIASNLSGTSTAATSPTIQPWTKPRAASAGEVQQLGSRAQIKSGLLGPPVVQRGASSRSRLSKLSGEIDAETTPVVSTSPNSQLPAFVPADSDYLNSKLYARTIKAQKALEKERAKAASKGKMSRYDSEAARSTSSLAVPRLSTDTGRPASIMSVASVGKIRSARRSALGWFKSSSEVALSPPSPDPIPPSPPLPTSRSSTALPIGTRSAMNPYPPPSPNFANEAALRSANSSSDYLREARETVAAQKAPPMSSRQPSGSSSSSSSHAGEGGQELVRPGPIPVRKSRASPSGSFQHSPTIQEASPPTTPVDEQHAARQVESAVPSTAPRNLTRPPRQDSQSRPSSTTPTAPAFSPETPISASSVPSRSSTSPSNPVPTRSSSPPNRNLPPPSVSSRPPPNGPPPSVAPLAVRASSVPFPTPVSARNDSRGSQPPTSPSKPGPTQQPSVMPPPLLTPDTSLAQGAEAGVKRRKSSLGLLFGGGGSRIGKSAPSPTTPTASTPSDKSRGSRRVEERSTTESKPVVKEKVKDKVKESFFGRVKRPEAPPEPKPAVVTPTPRSRPMPSSSAPPLVASAPRTRAPRPPPGAQPPASQYHSPPHTAVSDGPAHSSPESAALVTSARAPDSSSSASTEFSTLSSSSSTLPPTPSSGRSSSTGLSKSVNGAIPKSNGGGAFSNFFGRNRTKSLGGGGGGQKLSRSKNATPVPGGDDHKHHQHSMMMPVLSPSSKGGRHGFNNDRMTPVVKNNPSRAAASGTPSSQDAAFPGVDNYGPHHGAAPHSNELLVTAHRGYTTFA